MALTVRRGESLLIAIVLPVLLLLFFGAAPLFPVDGEHRMNFLLPGILALAVMSTSMVSLGIATAFERYYGVLKRLGGSPLPRLGLITAKIISIMALQVVQVGLLGLVAFLAFGWRPAGQPALVLLTLLIGSLTFAAIGLLLAGTLRAESTLAAANGLYLVFLLIGDMVFPLAQLPLPLVAVARVLPAAAFAEALRATLGPDATGATGSLILLALWGLAALLAAATKFRWE